MPTITKRSVDAVRPTTKDAYLWDSELSGFGLKTTPKGRKVYLVQYRLGGRKGRTRRVTIGTHGLFTADEARQIARKLLGQVAVGIDPAEKPIAGKSANLEGVLGKFLIEYAEPKLKASTAVEYKRLARAEVVPVLGHRQIESLGPADVAKLHSAMASKPYQANRTLSLLSKFFNWCEVNGYRERGSNPCQHVVKFRERSRERFLQAEEFERLGAALDAMEASDASPWAAAALRLLILTGARLSEILTLQWSYIDWERRVIRLPDSKTGAKSLHLNDPAIAVLKAVPRLPDNPYVIVGAKDGRHLVNLQKRWRKVRHAAGLDDVRIHDLRHTFASVAAGGGASLPMIGALLGHTQPATTARYAHLANDPLAEASRRIGASIEQAMGQTGKHRPR